MVHWPQAVERNCIEQAIDRDFCSDFTSLQLFWSELDENQYQYYLERHVKLYYVHHLAYCSVLIPVTRKVKGYTEIPRKVCNRQKDAFPPVFKTENTPFQ